MIVPNPKKRDLMDCGNWRGISMLEVAIVTENLNQRALEHASPDESGSKVGFVCEHS